MNLAVYNKSVCSVPRLVRKVRMTSNGIQCQIKDISINLDPKRSVHDEINFVSHAHSDHLPNRNGGTILSSNETKEIANLRGFKMENHIEKHEEYDLIDTGHILGSKGLLVNEIFYTGDISTRNRGFLKGAKIPKCKTLVTECTFGIPEFVFPSLQEIETQVNNIVSDLYSRGKPVILMGYQLGKSQTISQLFGHWDPLYYHDSVKKMNDLHRELGINIKDAMGHSEAEKKGLLDKKPWLMIAPMMSNKNSFVKHMKSKYDAITIGFSGWAKSSRFIFGRRCDHSVPLSDHCDFNELVNLVLASEAEKVYTVHGFVEEFSTHLRRLGIDAQPLKEESLDDFL